MLRRKVLKRRGQAAFYRNWKSCIIICFLYAILVGGTIFSFTKSYEVNGDTLKVININNFKGPNNSEIVNEFINGINGSKPIENEFLNSATRGVLGNISNNVSKTGSYLFGFLNAINQFLFKDHVWASVIIIVGALLSLVYWIFVSKVLEVGNARFFLENRKYTKTRYNKLFLPYKLNKRTWHIAYTMFIKNIYTLLWSFTIVGGFVKYYSYMLVPYILAENPKLKPKEVLKLSREMMDGYKWEMFKLDFSFIGYQILGVITFNISNLVYTTPYMNAVKAEVYMYLRELAKTKRIKNARKLNDKLLDGDVSFSEYPIYEYMLRDIKRPKWLSYNYKRDYKFLDIILIFFIIAIIGWIWEVLLLLFQEGVFVNRGTLYGPWLPIYGAGAVVMLVLLKKLRNNPLVYFIAAMAVSGVIEYGTSLYLEVVHHMAWWDYSGFFLNINGRVCLEGLMLFGIGGLATTYVVAPILANLLDKVKHEIKVIIAFILVLFMAFDFYVSGSNPNTGEGITTDIGFITTK